MLPKIKKEENLNVTRCVSCKCPQPAKSICFSCYTNIINFILGSRWNTKEELFSILVQKGIIHATKIKELKKTKAPIQGD